MIQTATYCILETFPIPCLLSPPSTHKHIHTHTLIWDIIVTSMTFFAIFCLFFYQGFHLLTFVFHFPLFLFYLINSKLYEFAKKSSINLVWTVVLPFFAYCSSSFHIPKAYLRHCHTSMDVFFSKNSYFRKKPSS